MGLELQPRAEVERARNAIAGRRVIIGMSVAVGCLLFLLQTPVASAAARFAAPNGNDNNPGTLTRPWRTVSKAVDRLSAGDTLYIRAGTYFESPIMRRSGTASAPIVVRSYPGEHVVLDSGYPELQTPGNSEWELVNATTGEYRTKRSYSSGDIYAYVDGIAGYENERVVLVPYKNALHFRSTTDAFNPTAFYVGPGTLKSSDGRIHVRMAKTTDLHAVEARYGTVFSEERPDPSDYSIILSQSSHTLRVSGAHLVFKDLTLHQAKRTILLEADAHHLRFDGITAWMGSRSISVTGTGVHHVTMTGCRLYGDSPLWVFWSDMKDAPAPADLLRGTSVDLRFGTHDWEIAYCHIRGSGQDLIGTNRDEYNVVVHHNRIENAADDAMEIEGTLNVGRVEVYENYFGNCLTAIAPGQDTPRFDGPLLVYRNVIALLRDPPINRKEGINGWNGGGRHGYEYMFKQSTSSSYNTRNAHYYHNTLLMLNSNGRGINITPKYPAHTRIANNLMVMVNGVVNGRYQTGSGQVVDGNLYWKVKTNDIDPLLDRYDTVRQFASATGMEVRGVGSTPRIGTDPRFATFEFGVDQTSGRWSLRPDAERFGPADFLLSADSPARDAGIGIPPHPTLGTMPDTRASRDIGAIPYGTPAEAFDVFPFNVEAAPPGEQTGHDPVNRPPDVNAGPDRDMQLGGVLQLGGTASDDGLPDPPATLTTRWMLESGPAQPLFDDPSQLDTPVRFTAPGTYVLKLIADDGAIEVNDTLTLQVHDAPEVATLIEQRIGSGSDDAEERWSGRVTLSSSDLELVTDGSTQTVGLRFTDLAIPRGASITRAFIRFQVDESSNERTSLFIYGQADDDAPTFSTASGGISTRPRTSTTLAWMPEEWRVVGQTGSIQQTPNLARIIEEVVRRPGWRSGHAMAFIITGYGRRTAESYDGDPAAAPLLIVELGNSDRPNDPLPNQPPMLSAGEDQVVTLPGVAHLAGTMIDDGLPDPPGVTRLTWSMVEGPFEPRFDDHTALVTEASFSAPGVYRLQLAADDGALSARDTVVVTVREPGSTSAVVRAQVSASEDDAEEQPSGNVYVNSSDLELVNSHGLQLVGMRFPNVQIPKGAVVVNAYIQFQVDEINSEATSLTLFGHATDDAEPFTDTNHHLTSRPRTRSSVSWSPPPWTRKGDAGPEQRTSDLAPVLREIIERPGWTYGNALVVMVSGIGQRTAESFDGDPQGAPTLHVELASETIAVPLAGIVQGRPEPVLAPNPMRDWASLRFTTQIQGPVKVRLFDVNGRQVRTVLDEENLPAGNHRIDLRAWGHDGFRAGVYFYRVETPARVSKGRFLVVD